MKTCRKCGSRLRTSNVTPGYKYWCPRCDEDMYGVEAVEDASVYEAKEA